jgi:hypothetical protein
MICPYVKLCTKNTKEICLEQWGKCHIIIEKSKANNRLRKTIDLRKKLEKMLEPVKKYETIYAIN